MSKHSLLAPSAAHRWLRCPGSVPLSAEIFEAASPFALEGTWAHRLAELRLTGHDDFPDDEAAKAAADGVDVAGLNGPVNFYVDFVKSLGGRLFVEQRLSISGITHEEGARGTSDAVILKENELIVADLKFGMGDKIEAGENPQLMIYAGAAYQAFSVAYDIDTVTMIIVQPRLDHVSQWSITVDELETRLAQISEKADQCLTMAKLEPDRWQFAPSLEACKYCKARGTCAALARYSLTAAGIEMLSGHAPAINADELAGVLAKLDLVEKWVSIIRETAMTELLAGKPVPGYKLVSGREGPRKWTSEKDVEKKLRSYHLSADERYVKKLISPTQAEKLAKCSTITPENWAELSGFIQREPGKPTLVPETDPRPAYHVLTADDYPDESATTATTGEKANA